MLKHCPRLTIAGLSGDSGKTLVSLGLLAYWRKAGLSPAAFKKGPDYIDAAWLGWAAGSPCHNLDTYMQQEQALRDSFTRHASQGVNVIEGNRGLSDGLDLRGSHSTAALAQLLSSPVVLVVNASKVTRTVAASVLGCRQLEPAVNIAGVILNRVAGARHRELVCQAVEQLAGVPVLGAIPRLKTDLLPDRHLGLVPPQEREGVEQLEQRLLAVVEENLDCERLLQIAQQVPELDSPQADRPPSPVCTKARVGVFWDSAFTFYYPENLQALRDAGAELVFISALNDRQLPEVQALYLGGGFPETHAWRLSENRQLRQQVQQAALRGLPVFAECGGMIYLGRSLTFQGQCHPMSGVLPIDLELFRRPQGHGYVELLVDRPNPLFPQGTRLRGHEFHYSRVVAGADQLPTAFQVVRGTGSVNGRDGFVFKNVIAGYTHLHAVGVPGWAPALVEAAIQYGGR